MKIEKVNDNQIRCTLTREDLDSRHMKLSELAYGTEKAKMLFRELMQQASYQFGFNADDIPLMIEAVPISSAARCAGWWRWPPWSAAASICGRTAPASCRPNEPFARAPARPGIFVPIAAAEC